MIRYKKIVKKIKLFFNIFNCYRVLELYASGPKGREFYMKLPWT